MVELLFSLAVVEGCYLMLEIIDEFKLCGVVILQFVVGSSHFRVLNLEQANLVVPG